MTMMGNENFLYKLHGPFTRGEIIDLIPDTFVWDRYMIIETKEGLASINVDAKSPSVKVDEFGSVCFEIFGHNYYVTKEGIVLGSWKKEIIGA